MFMLIINHCVMVYSSSCSSVPSEYFIFTILTVFFTPLQVEVLVLVDLDTTYLPPLLPLPLLPLAIWPAKLPPKGPPKFPFPPKPPKSLYHYQLRNLFGRLSDPTHHPSHHYHHEKYYIISSLPSFAFVGDLRPHIVRVGWPVFGG
jgi:hypothetical protein